MSKCRSCDAEVIWATTKAGKQMPLDAEPSPKGTFVIVNGKTWKEDIEDRALHRPVHTSHFATCVNADEHRSKR